MTESVSPTTLEKLRQHLAALRELCRTNPRHLRDRVSAVLEELQQWTQQLRIVDEEAEREAPRHSPTAEADRQTLEAQLAVHRTVARVSSNARTLEEAAAPILAAVCENLDWAIGELWTLDPETSAVECVGVHPTASAAPSVASDGAPARTPSFGGPIRSALRHYWIGPRGSLHVPITALGDTCALFRFSRHGARDITECELDLLTAVARQVGQLVERRRCEKLVEQIQEWKAAFLDASLDAVITIDRDGRVIEYNAAAETMFGYPRAHVIGRQIIGLIVPPRLENRVRAHFGRYQSSGESRLMGKRIVSVGMRSDGTEFAVEITVARMRIRDEPLLTIYARDASERVRSQREVKAYQRRLRALTAELLVAEELERRRLSVDLHDGLSQTIALVQLKLTALRRSAGARLHESLDEIERLIEQADRSARSITFELSPPLLHELGLEPALQWLAENIHTRYGVDIVFEDDGRAKPADQKTRVILFRSIRELLINAAKHAKPRKIRMSLARENGWICAAVEDDGSGMVGGGGAAKGSGLFSIRERIEDIGGEMSIASVEGQGTKVRLRARLAMEEWAPAEATR